MTKIKKTYIIIFFIIMSLLAILYFNNKKQKLELSGYGFAHESNGQTDDLHIGDILIKIKIITKAIS